MDPHRPPLIKRLRRGGSRGSARRGEPALHAQGWRTGARKCVTETAGYVRPACSFGPPQRSAIPKSARVVPVTRAALLGYTTCGLAT